jgi:hypothetical protein
VQNLEMVEEEEIYDFRVNTQASGLFEAGCRRRGRKLQE